MTMHTKPLSPWAATLNPEAVRIFTVACAETFSGAALLANAISASGVIMYSLSGGYLALCPRTEATCRLTRSNASAAIIFRILNSSPQSEYFLNLFYGSRRRGDTHAGSSPLHASRASRVGHVAAMHRLVQGQHQEALPVSGELPFPALGWL